MNSTAAETETCRFEVNEGVVVVRVRPAVTQSVHHAQENVAVASSLAGAERRALLLDLRAALPLPSEVRHFYSGEIFDRRFSAMGVLVAATPLGRMLGNLYLRIARIGVPTRLFETEEQALAWLGRRT
jgi:hypothetical protein